MGAGKLGAGLYLVATPIGAARDITLRALDILEQADVLAAEDTRNTRKLMDIHGVKLADRRLIAYHDHSGQHVEEQMLAAVRDGKSVAYVSDAGTPMLADPGFELARSAASEGLPVFSAPGASALLAALCVAAQPTDRFFFAGFAPNKTSARKKFFADLVPVQATVVFYESPKRAAASLRDMTDVFGGERPVSFCRELTKKFEEVVRGTLNSVTEDIAARQSVKGEVVIVLGPPPPKEISTQDIDAELRILLQSERVKDAARQIAEQYGLPRKEIYGRALKIIEGD